MLQTIIALCALAIAVLFLPLWVQLVAFAVAVWVAPYRYALLAPAALADALYAPGPVAFLMTLVVAVMLVIRWLLLTQTRFASVVYGVEA